MELEDLAVFRDVARLGSFSRVARERNVAVSSVARRIDLLENAFGAPLLNRSTRRMHLTEAGEQLLRTAGKVLSDVSDAREAIAAGRAEPTGGLKVTAPATFGRRYVASAVPGFLAKYPAIQLALQLTDEIIDLERHGVDAAVRIGVLPDSDLLATPIAVQRRLAVASPSYLAIAGRPTRQCELLQHNCLTHGSTGHRVGWWEFAGVNAGKPLDVRGNFRSDDSESLLKATLAGLGIAHLATWLIAEDLIAGRLVALFDDEIQRALPPKSAIHVVRVPGRAEGRARLFVEHLKADLLASGDLPIWERSLASRTAS